MKKIKNILLVLIIIFLNSCEIIAKYEKYSNYNSYSVLPKQGMMFNNPVLKLDIGWVSGNINIIRSDEYQKVAVIENTLEEYTNDFLCHYYHKEDTLFLKYCKSNTSMPKKINKSLTVYIPSKMLLTDINVDAVSSDLKITNVDVINVDVESVSGNIEINDAVINNMKFETVSGNVMAYINSNTQSVVASTISGTIIFSISDNVKGFKLEYKTLSGTLKKDFDTVLTDNYYTYKDDTYLSISVESTSGNLSIVKNATNKNNQ